MESTGMSFSNLLLVFLVLFIPTLWAIVNIARRDFGSIKKKAICGLFVVLVPPIGGIVYFVVYQIKKIAKKERQP